MLTTLWIYLTFLLGDLLFVELLISFVVPLSTISASKYIAIQITDQWSWRTSSEATYVCICMYVDRELNS